MVTTITISPVTLTIQEGEVETITVEDADRTMVATVVNRTRVGLVDSKEVTVMSDAKDEMTTAGMVVDKVALEEGEVAALKDTTEVDMAADKKMMAMAATREAGSVVVTKVMGVNKVVAEEVLVVRIEDVDRMTIATEVAKVDTVANNRVATVVGRKKGIKAAAAVVAIQAQAEMMRLVRPPSMHLKIDHRTATCSPQRCPS